MSAPTLIFVRHGQVGSQHFQHGEELPPGLIPCEVVDKWLDQRWLKEYDSSERRSLYRLLHRFSGCSEQEQLTQKERETYDV